MPVDLTLLRRSWEQSWAAVDCCCVYEGVDVLSSFGRKVGQGREDCVEFYDCLIEFGILHQLTTIRLEQALLLIFYQNQAVVWRNSVLPLYCRLLTSLSPARYLTMSLLRRLKSDERWYQQKQLRSVFFQACARQLVRFFEPVVPWRRKDAGGTFIYQLHPPRVYRVKPSQS